jgi:F-type H+-transporting ATPase subunit epsilon
MPVDVHVVTPEREVWSGETPLLIARGIDGELGIMGGHMPILVQLAVGPLRITREGGEDVIIVDGGFLHVATEEGVTRADVLATDAVPAAEVDIDAAKRALEELRAADDGTDPEVALAIERAAVRAGLGA